MKIFSIKLMQNNPHGRQENKFTQSQKSHQHATKGAE